MSSPTNAQGNRSLAAVTYALLERGFEVFTPFGDGVSADLIIALPDGGLVRSQVKTGRVTAKGRLRRVVFNTSTLHWKKKFRTGYSGKVDVFIIWCPETARCYCVPAEHVGVSTFSISVDNPAPYELDVFDFSVILGKTGSHNPPSRLDSESADCSSRVIRRRNQNAWPSKQDRVRSYVISQREATFRLRDIKASLPDVSAATIQLVLASMRREGLVERGPLSALNTTWQIVEQTETGAADQSSD